MSGPEISPSIPKDTYHGLENASENEPLITLWGYTGAPSS